MTAKLELKIIVGSTRQGRQADKVVPWVADRAAGHGAFATDVLDLRAYPLPMLGEAPVGAVPTDLAATASEWNRVLGEGDVFVMVTPEYNHSVPGVLKNAIDSVPAGRAFRNKAAGFVGYSGGKVGGARAVEHLAHIVIEAEMVPLRNAVLVSNVRDAFDNGVPTDPGADAAMQILLDDLAWWGTALRRARHDGQLPPARER